jgi:hypothetical protein
VWNPKGSNFAALYLQSDSDFVAFFDYSTCRQKQKWEISFEVSDISWDRSGSIFLIGSREGFINIYHGEDL